METPQNTNVNCIVYDLKTNKNNNFTFAVKIFVLVLERRCKRDYGKDYCSTSMSTLRLLLLFVTKIPRLVYSNFNVLKVRQLFLSVFK